jgi:hypothetical protein
MIQADTSSQQLVDIHNSDPLLLTAADSVVTTTRVTVASVVLVVAAHIPGALPEQARLAKETLAVTPLVVEVDQQVVAAAAPEVLVLQETLHKVKVDQEYQLVLPEVQPRMQVVVAAVVGL